MKRVLQLGLALTVISGFHLLSPESVSASKRSLATIAGTVNDAKGNPLADALVSLLKDGAKEVIKQTRTDSKGRFSAKIAPGRYGIRAVADGFNEVVFSSVEVRASQELIYRFNLQASGSGQTLPELRKDREDVRWALRSSQSRRSIFQIQESQEIALGTGVVDDPSELSAASDAESAHRSSRTRTHGVLETYVATNSFGSYPGINFAVSTPATEEIELIFAGQTGVGPNAPERFEVTGRIRPDHRHRIGVSAGAVKFGASLASHLDVDKDIMGQFSVRAVDEWVVRNGIVIVIGLDYSRFMGAGGAYAISPRFGVQYDANASTRIRAAYAPGGDEANTQSVAAFEDAEVIFKELANRPIALVDGQAVMERTRRFEVGVERVLDNNSTLEATAFFDTTSGRGVGLLSTPISAFSGETGESLITVANQQGAARGMRLVYTRRLSGVWTASAGYSFGRGQRLSPDGFSNPGEVFSSEFFQTAAVQVGAGIRRGTHIRTVFRFSSEATVFAIDPFAGRLGVYDPSLSIQVTQELPSFGLPLRAEAVLDARNLLDTQATVENGEVLTQLSTGRRSVRGGISVRF